VEERTRIINRIKSCLVRFGIRGFKSTLRKAAERLGALPTPEGVTLPPNTELRRDTARLRFVMDQIKAIEVARLERLQKAPKDGPHAMVCLLARVTGIGIETADMLVHEVGALRRLTGSPDESGKRRRERGLARAGNARARRGMIQVANG
jgi:transposase